jgi:hypothetical protein
MSRRQVDALAAGIAAVLPILAASSALAAPADQTFLAPSGPVILTRTLRRPLPDGAEIVSTRRYEVTIAAEGVRYRVDGRLVESEVAAPPSLQGLAAIERARTDAGLFPFHLDGQGLIASPAVPLDETTAIRAGTTARLFIASSSLAEPDRRQAEGLVKQLLGRSAGAGAQWPRDLFRPILGLRSETSRMELAGGQSGSVTTTIDARSVPEGSSIERTVITDTGGVQRVMQEIYEVRTPSK